MLQYCRKKNLKDEKRTFGRTQAGTAGVPQWMPDEAPPEMPEWHLGVYFRPLRSDYRPVDDSQI